MKLGIPYEAFGTKFLPTKFTDLTNKTIVTLTEQDSDFVIKLSPQGMLFEGKLKKIIQTEKDLQDFAKLVSDAWSEHRKLAPKIVKGDPRSI
jgi:hypothetical protein